MALNSKADQIVEGVVAAVETVASIRTVTRKPPGQDNYKEIPATQLPIAIVMGGIPQVENATPRQTNFMSILPVSISVLIMDNETPGQSIYNVADDLWAALMNLPADDKSAYLNGLARSYRVIPEQVFDISPPYIAFRYDLEITYIHTNGSI